MPEVSRFIQMGFSEISDPITGRAIHAISLRRSLHLGLFHHNTIVNMYFRFHKLSTALNAFDTMPRRNEASWNTVISGCARVGCLHRSMVLFSEMRKEGLGPNGFVMASLMSGWNRWVDLVGGGIQFHGLVLKAGLTDDVFVGTSLLHLYGSYGLVFDARRFFDEMPERNVVSWTALMVAFSKNGCPDEAVRAYGQMRKEGVVGNPNSFASVISSCSLLENEILGLQVIAHALISGCGTNVSVVNSVITMFDTLGRVEDAEHLFYWMKERDTISWNAMISAYSRGGMSEESMRCFSEMRHAGVRSDATTLSSLIYVCSSVEHLIWGQGFHALAVKDSLNSSLSVCNTLMNMYSVCRKCEHAELLFHGMSEGDLISWNTMISAYIQGGQYEGAFKLLAHMFETRKEMNHVTFANALAACSSSESLLVGKMVHALAIQIGLQENLVLGNALITMYSKCEAMREAICVFQMMPDRDVITWNALIGGCVENDEQREAMRAFVWMRETRTRPNYITMVNVLGASSSPRDLLQFGMPLHAHIILTRFEIDELVQNSLLTMYSKCGNFDASLLIFNGLTSKTAVSWNAMISSKAHHGHGEDALKLFMDMRHAGVELDQFSLSGGLAASSSLASLEEGRQVHGLIVKLGFELDLHVNNATMDMYGKCGSMDDMLKVLPGLSDRSRQSWNIIISVYARHGLFEKAQETFKEMLQIGPKPDYITFVSLLSACNHAGLVEKGLNYYEFMTSEFGIGPRIEHCVCIVDLLGRCGRLTEAEKFIEDMPVVANDLIWRSLLASSKIYRDLEMGRKAAHCLLHFDSLDDSAYVLLSNICATTGRWEDVETLRKHMKSINLKKKPACSWIKVKNKVSSFGSGDLSHPLTKQIYEKLEGILQMVKNLGYVADTTFSLHDIDEEQKEQNLWKHSEKLALAFGLLTTPEGSALRVFKNLRVCGDCHLVYKLVSCAVGRELLLRDAYRFHHFKDGDCSCSDYW